jgi:hypothetical protein
MKFMTAKEGGNRIQLNSGWVTTGAALVGTAGVLAATGVIVGSTALLKAILQWIEELDEKPSDIAKVRWGQLKAAGTAGADAWRKSIAPRSAA